ncbi:MAG TPA: sulfatase, partial [Candidatus Hydrogenedentes bacterium]|nr:sulfatase [Candidatus Hydrogenedentota bacterium]
LTGMHNHANGMYGLQHAAHHFQSFDKVVSLPKRLADRGYHTALAGKYHVWPEKVYPFETTVPNAKTPDLLAEKCRPVMEAKDGRPFFLYFCTTEPHRPFKHQPEDLPAPKDVVVPPYLPDTSACRAELARYYASVRQADRALERLLDLLDETGHREDTLVLFVSDNGIPFPGAKTNVYEPGVNLPCVARVPDAPNPGGVCGAFVSWADITPTLCAWAGVPVDADDVQGRSFLEAMREERPAGWDTVYGSHTFHQVTMYYPMRWVREGKWKLIWNLANGLSFPFANDLWESETWQDFRKRGDEVYGKRRLDAYLNRPPLELYDLEADPDEIHNLADDPAHAETLQRLHASLKAFQERTADPWVIKWEHE